MVSTVAHLRSLMDAFSDTGGKPIYGRDYQAFYHLAYRIKNSRVKDKLNQRLKMLESEKLKVISQEEFEFLREAKRRL